MIEIDWGDLRPTQGQRARVEASLDRLGGLVGPVIGLRRKGSGFEAQLTTFPSPTPAEVRLQGDDLAGVVERAVALLEVVVRESWPPPS